MSAAVNSSKVINNAVTKKPSLLLFSSYHPIESAEWHYRNRMFRWVTLLQIWLPRSLLH